ncbi:MAG: FAD-dependent oxidoreductase [bacterium]|nr:FAD-dependent oxidoreductase [bacterium]
MKNSYDAIVGRGGAAGIGAAFAAALGKKTLLIERGALIGGAATHCGIGFLINCKAHDRHDVVDVCIGR